jgi:hypothetical protein
LLEEINQKAGNVSKLDLNKRFCALKNYLYPMNTHRLQNAIFSTAAFRFRIIQLIAFFDCCKNAHFAFIHFMEMRKYFALKK